jgi:hypothetical protein
MSNELNFFCAKCNVITSHISLQLPNPYGYEIECSFCHNVLWSKAILCNTCRKTWWIPGLNKCLWCEAHNIHMREHTIKITDRDLKMLSDMSPSDIIEYLIKGMVDTPMYNKLYCYVCQERTDG